MIRASTVVAAALALIPLAPAAAVETISATFTTPDGGVTTGLYSGTVKVTVSGTGNSDGSEINDAFYKVATETHDASYYQLTFGTTTLVPLDPAQDAFHFAVGGLPAYNPTHVYSFLLDTGAVTPTTLHFGVSDGVFGDNGGSYRIIVGGIPEAATWTMMIAGFGLVGATLRRRTPTVAA